MFTSPFVQITYTALICDANGMETDKRSLLIVLAFKKESSAADYLLIQSFYIDKLALKEAQRVWK